jgi:hypothetical protein
MNCQRLFFGCFHRRQRIFSLTRRTQSSSSSNTPLVAAAVGSIAQLLYFLMMALNRRD